MANFFSSAYWKALYFKAMGGQETAVDPNVMSGSFAGSSSWTGVLEDGAAATSLRGRLVRRLHTTQRSTRRRQPPLSPEPVSAPVQTPPPPPKIKRGLLTKLGKEPEYQQTRIVIEMARYVVASGMNKKAIENLDRALKAIDGPRIKSLRDEAAARAVQAIEDEASQRLAEIAAENDQEDEEILLLVA